MLTDWGSATDRGAVREANEDALLAYPPVFLVADGMGGHDAGDVASRIAVEEFADLAGEDGATPEDVHGCFLRAAHRIGSEFSTSRQGGTTVAGIALTRPDGVPSWLVFTVGDSRVYRRTPGGVVQVSVDHSVTAELVARGELDPADVPTHPSRHVLTRVLGTAEPADPDYWLLPAQVGDRFLLCTDGLTRELADAEIASVLAAATDPRAAAAELVARAVARGARDNVTVVVVDGGARTGLRLPRAGADARDRAWHDEREGTTLPRPRTARDAVVA
ncbi:PP2C family protein-serine/threonine phosphatase [Cellulomonas endophytica]|uniref:PP2C family protein-serine/threonine phosphatase n=1 Tax=Cellulomonas endophytica TaxID=2494735 RepID=UPI00101181B4|nr:protein phosphatase 2C domain-containing protein [Cellulomonas endophytica]